MEKSFVFNSINKDRVYKAEDFASYFASFIGNGIFPNPASQLQVVDNNDMTVTVKEGKAWINGYYYQNTNDFILKLEPADSVLNRVDRVVLRLDFNKRAINLAIKKGEFSSNAVSKQLQRDADAHEIALADIKISAGAISITQADITDLRLNKNLCGIVHGVVEQVDTTAIFNQFQSWYSTTKDNYDKNITLWTKEKKQAFDDWYSKNTQGFSKEFEEWFESLKDKLDGDVATKLQKQIDTLKKDVEDYANKIGNIKDLKTTNKDNLVESVNELFTNVDNGKDSIYSAITGKKVTPKSKDFEDLVEGIKDIKLGQGTAQASEVLEGTTFTNDTGIVQKGSMKNYGVISIEPSISNIYDSGYYKSIIFKPITAQNIESNFETFKPENIKKDVNIAGIVGTYSGESEFIHFEKINTDNDQVIFKSPIDLPDKYEYSLILRFKTNSIKYGGSLSCNGILPIVVSSTCDNYKLNKNFFNGYEALYAEPYSKSSGYSGYNLNICVTTNELNLVLNKTREGAFDINIDCYLTKLKGK
ncbi:hypothetical protein [Clostridium botulinum]|uniref:hypothetical protein n=1 Tax=Clostridium botulinum TaxID=1491 RepID=UPI001E5D1DE8|nr:hypothetical protein [Clostridium botulinum]